jgi:hypothetical protein
MLDEIDCRAWAGALIDDDPDGPDCAASLAAGYGLDYPWPRWVVALLDRLKAGCSA